MLASVWLTAACVCLMAWYLRCRGLMRDGLGIDPHRAVPGGKGRALPAWLLLAGQVTLLVGVAPLYSASLLLRYGILPALLWTVLGSALLAAVPYAVTLWATLRSGGRDVAGLMYEYLGGRGKQVLSVLGWLLCVLTLAMMVGIVASGWDNEPQEVRAEDYLKDPAAYREAQDAAEKGTSINITPFMDIAAFEQARRNVDWEARQRTVATTATLGMMGLAALYGLMLFRHRQRPLLATALILAGLAAVAWLAGSYPLALPQQTWVYILLGYALLCALTPAHWLSAPRDALIGVLTVGMALTCLAATLFSPLRIAQPVFVGWRIPNGGNLFPFLFLTTAAGGLNAVYLLSIPHRVEASALREHQAYSVAFGGALLAAFVGAVAVVAVGQYADLPLGALGNVFTAPRLLQNSIATLLTSLGLPLWWASLWVSLVFVGCAIGALDVAARLGSTLMHGIYFNQSVSLRTLAPDRVLAAFITVVAAFLLSNVEYWILWPLFGAASLGACAVALLPVVIWLRRSGRRIWGVLALLCAVLAALSLGTMAASLIAQIHPSPDNLLYHGTLFLHAVVATLLLGAMIHALTGIGRPPRALPPLRGPRAPSR